MEIESLMRLVEGVSASALDSFSYKERDFSIKMSKAAKGEILQRETNCQPKATLIREKLEATGAEEKGKNSGKAVKSPLVGVFYGAPSEGATPFVQLGDSVKKGQTLAIVEAMKLMNEIESDYDGVVKEVCVKNGEAVEYGQDLFIIETEGN